MTRPATAPTPPQGGLDDDRQFREKLVRITAWMAIGGIALAALIDAATGNLRDPARLLVLGCFVAAAMGALWLLRNGRLELSAQLLLWALLAGTTAIAAVNGGVNAPALIMYVVPVALATRILGGRTAIAMALACGVALIGLAYLDSAGLLPADRFTHNPYRRALTPALVIAILGVLWYYVAEDVAARVRRLREGSRQLSETLSELEARTDALAEREAQLELVVNNVPSMMAYFDAEDRCQWANASYAREKGTTPAGLIGRRLQEILPPAEYTEQVRRFVERASTGEQLSYLRDSTDAAGRMRLFQVDLSPDRGPDGSIRGRIVAQRDVTEERAHERLLDAIVSGTASASGEAFFHALTEHLATALGVRHAMLSEFVDGGTRARALAFRDGDAFAPPFAYALAGAPCGLIVQDGEAYFERDVATRFPEDEALARRGIQGYYGVALCDRADRPMGLLAIMDTEPLAISEQTRSVMRIFATRAATELERQRADRDLRESEARFQDFAQASGDWFWETDAENRFTWFSDSVEKVTGRPAAWHYGKTRAEFAASHQDLSADPWKSHLEIIARREPFRDFLYLSKGIDDERWVSASGVPRFGAGGRFLGYRGVGSDVTAKVLSERRANAADARLKAAIEQLDEGFALWDREDRLVVFNRKFVEFSGVPQLVRPGVRAEDLLRGQVAIGYAPEAVGREEAWVEERLAARHTSARRGEIRRGDRWYVASNQRLPDDALVTIVIDFTQRKLAEDSLRASHQHFEALFRASPTPAVIFTLVEGRILDCNSAYCRQFGYARDQIIGRTGRELNLYRDPAERERIFANMSAARRVSTLELEMVKASGETCTVAGFLELVEWEGERCVMAQLLDITQQKQAEAALRESRKRFAALFNESAVPQLVSNPATRINDDANRAFCELVGYARDEIVGRRGQDVDLFWGEEDRLAVSEAMPTGHGNARVVEVRLRRRDGTQRIALVSGCLIELDNGRQVAWSVIDVTDRKLAEAAVHESEVRFSALFHNSLVPQLVTHPGTRATEVVNEAFVRLIGYPRERLLGLPGADVDLFWSTEDSNAAGVATARGGTHGAIELKLRRADGEQRVVLAAAFAIQTAAGKRVAWSLMDVTEQREARRRIEESNEALESKVAERTAELSGALENLKDSQEALLRSEKLAALGRLVAGVAHELNTPIGNGLLSATTLHEHTEVFAAKAASGGLRRSALEAYVAQSREASGILVRNLEKAAVLISSFKQVAADQTSSQRRAFALDEVIGEVLLAHRPMLKTSPIAVAIDVPAGIRMDSYPGPLGQVLGNLITNAVLHGYDGQPRGTVTISARVDGADTAEIAVRDQGRGISEADLKRIFDPFFTTKLGRGGTGLGLGICHNIVTGALGGNMRVASRLGEGSSFIVRLPLSAPQMIGNREAA